MEELIYEIKEYELNDMVVVDITCQDKMVRGNFKKNKRLEPTFDTYYQNFIKSLKYVLEGVILFPDGRPEEELKENDKIVD